MNAALLVTFLTIQNLWSCYKMTIDEVIQNFPNGNEIEKNLL